MEQIGVQVIGTEKEESFRNIIDSMMDDESWEIIDEYEGELMGVNATVKEGVILVRSWCDFSNDGTSRWNVFWSSMDSLQKFTSQQMTMRDFIFGAIDNFILLCDLKWYDEKRIGYSVSSLCLTTPKELPEKYLPKQGTYLMDKELWAFWTSKSGSGI